jgi:hypothetical protein
VSGLGEEQNSVIAVSISDEHKNHTTPSHVEEQSNLWEVKTILYLFFFLVAPTRGSVLPFRSIGLILLSFFIRTVGRTPWTGD